MQKVIRAAWMTFLLLPMMAFAKSPDYLTIEALPGDGVYSLLRRYGLVSYPCNHEEFYKINQLDRNSVLFAGRNYKLPILVFNYNGLSIRSTIGDNDWDKAVRIQNYNLGLVDKKIRKVSYTDDKVLWVPYHELHCPEAEVPAMTEEDKTSSSPGSFAVKPRHYPIFGPEYAYTPLASNKLAGKVYYIVAGHGGPDPGAMGKLGGHTLCEDEYAYDVALRLTRNLIAHGAVAYMVNRDANDGIREGKFLDCDNDEQMWGGMPLPLKQRERLHQRSDAVNNLFEENKKQGIPDQNQIAICIHIDSRSRGHQTDVFFYHHPKSNEGKRIADNFHQTFLKKYKKYRPSGEYEGTVSGRDLHMLRECKPSTVYIELGNIRNSFDQLRITIDSNRQALANWLLEGLME